MAGFAARYRAVPQKARFRVTVAVEAKAVEPRFDPDLEVRAFAAMTMDAGVEAAPIRVIMVAEQAIDGDMLAMIEIQGQRLGAPQRRFTERNLRATGN